MNKPKEALLTLLKVLAVFLVLACIYLVAMYLNGRYRLWIIRATLHSPIPGWLKTVLWGWWYSCVCEDYLAEYGCSECDSVDSKIEITHWMPPSEPPEEAEKALEAMKNEQIQQNTHEVLC